MDPANPTPSQSVNMEALDTSNVPSTQSVTVSVDTSYVPLPHSVSKVTNTSNAPLHLMSVVVDIPNVPLSQPVSEVVNTPIVALPQPVPEVIQISNVATNPVKSEVSDSLIEPALKSESEIKNHLNVSSQNIQPDSNIIDTSYAPLPLSVVDVVDMLNATLRQLESEVVVHPKVPSPQSESEVVNILKSESESCIDLKMPSQPIQFESKVDDSVQVPLPHTVSEFSHTSKLSPTHSAKPDMVDNAIASSSQFVNPNLIDTLPMLQSVNIEVPGTLNVTSSELFTSELIDASTTELPRPEALVLQTFNEPPNRSVEDAEITKVPSAQSSDSSKVVETLNVPVIKAKTVENLHKYRKTKFEAIFDDDDDDDDDTRTKLDSSLVEHTSVMRGAIPVLPLALAYFCLVCNVLVPGLGTIFSGMFCLCFGIPRFGVHDGAKHRIGSLVINLLVGCGQLFTVLFCLVGWGWSVWWGVIMVKIARKYRKLKAEAMAAEAEAPPVTANNHTRA